MGMDHRCLVLSGRLLHGQEPADVHARMAAAFGMEMAGFRERVFARTPLIIRRGLDVATAEAQAAQLRDMGAEADVWPDDGPLIWLRRDQQVRGPLPEEALGRYAEPGDRWCHDGGQTWFAWEPAPRGTEPPPLPLASAMTTHDVDAHETEAFSASEDGEAASVLPPPLPAAVAPAPQAAPQAVPVKRSISIAAIFALLFAAAALHWHFLSPATLLVAFCAIAYLYPRPMLRGRAIAMMAVVFSVVALAMWMHRPAPVAVAQHYVPRPLKPLAADAPAAAAGTPCMAQTAVPKNDEDRFLLTGQRLLTGRAQRKGDTYVAEAAVSLDGQCQPSALQLYVFRDGVFIGTVLDKAAGIASTKLADFDLVDDQHLRVTMAECTDKPVNCAATTVRQFAVMPGGGGWTLGETK